jgi:methylated-DNA-[protein]-cysteine S-methyltransferase
MRHTKGKIHERTGAGANSDVRVHHYFSRLVGWLELRVSDRGVQSISYVAAPKSPRMAKEHPVVSQLIEVLDRYFNGETVKFSVPLDLDNGTPFQHKVWSALTRIPYGQTRSYAEVAEAVGTPQGARAVGSANKSNSIPILIPCHRVIKADRGLGGYDSGVHIKKRLLELEGVRI